MDAGGKLALTTALRRRILYFSDGVVIGSSGFVKRFFERERGYFGSKRKTGARKMRGADCSDLLTLRDLRVGVLGI